MFYHLCRLWSHCGLLISSKEIFFLTHTYIIHKHHTAARSFGLITVTEAGPRYRIILPDIVSLFSTIPHRKLIFRPLVSFLTLPHKLSLTMSSTLNMSLWLFMFCFSAAYLAALINNQDLVEGLLVKNSDPCFY